MNNAVPAFLFERMVNVRRLFQRRLQSRGPRNYVWQAEPWRAKVLLHTTKEKEHHK